MPGVKGQKNPSKHPRKNGYMVGTQQPIRVPEVFSFKLFPEDHARVKAELEENGWSKQEWVDHLIDHYYGEQREKSGIDESDRTPADEKTEKSEPDWDELKKSVLSRFKLGRQSATYKKLDQALDLLISEVSDG